MSLTDDWKAGKLEEEYYYVKIQDGSIMNMWYDKTHIQDINGWVVLAPVPSYEELQQLKSLAENGQSAIDTNQRLSKKIESLRELLRESRDILNVEGYYPTVYKINAATGESEE